ncbi:hypothetical protein Tco_0526368 [Tanacetum coccineum]
MALLAILYAFQHVNFRVMSQEKPVMSSASSAVTYTSVYTDSEPGRPVAPPSPDYIPGPEEPQTPPVPQDEDEREPMFIQPHDPDYVPEPIYPEYIPLEDEHEFPVEEQPLPPVDSPTAESPGYVTESDPEEDPKEYEDDETEDGLVDYPIDGGEDGDDDDDDSSGDDADDEDEEDEEEEEEKHLALADSAVIVPTVELVSPPRITVWLQASISLPPKAGVERLLAMPTPPPSPLTSLSLPSVGERLARCTDPFAHSSPPPALVDAVTVVLPSPPLPTLPPSLYIPPPVDRRDDVLESEQPPHAEERRRGSREVGYGIRDTWVDPAEAVPKIAPMIIGEDSTTRISQRVTIDSQRVNLLIGDRMTLQETAVHFELQIHHEQVHETRSQMQQVEIAELQETGRRRQAQMIKTLRVMRDMRREMGNMQAELLALRE